MVVSLLRGIVPLASSSVTLLEAKQERLVRRRRASNVSVFVVVKVGPSLN